MYYLMTLGYSDESVLKDDITDQGYTTITEQLRLIFASNVITGFGFGASSIAIFARVAGGIYTKAADGKSLL
jgi:Na+/H+-translocating membrane pyrophosphatase